LDVAAGVGGAEWSLAWPPIGIALDSSARVMALLERVPGASTFGLAAGAVKTAAAGGTEVSGTADAACVAGVGVRMAAAVSSRPLPHAINNTAVTATALQRSAWFISFS